MGEANFFFEPHDSEIMRAGEVLAKLNEKRGKITNLEAFRREIIERFGEAGFKVEVRVLVDAAIPEGSIPLDEPIHFDIDFIDRLSGEFDPDRQVHEVTNDLAGLGTGGVIKTQGGLSLLQGGHAHTHGDGHQHEH